MKLAIFGFGGHAREVARQVNDESITFVVDNEYSCGDIQPIDNFNPLIYKILVAVADSKARKSIVDRLPINTQFWSFIHPSAQIMDKNIKIGEGSFIGANSILTTNITLGNHTLLNRGNHIGHDTIIGDYFSMMPSAVVGGNVVIGDEVYLGSCSNVREKINITSGVKIGMSAAVVKNITKEGTYIGVPAKPL